MKLLVWLGLWGLLSVSSVSTVTLRVIPPFVQFFSGQSIILSCIEEVGGWRVKRRTISGQSGVSCVRGEDDSCQLSSSSPSDTGSYWCEHWTGDKTPEVFITVTDLDLILDSPVLPVETGSNVSLHCRSRPGLYLNSQIYRDGPLIQAEPLNTNWSLSIISNVSKLHEGTYYCSALNYGSTVRSTERQLRVKDTSPKGSVSVEWVVRLLLVSSPYCVCTALLMWMYFSQRRSGSAWVFKPSEQGEENDDIADVTTEHHF